MHELTRLSNATLGALPEPVGRPRYDRGTLTPGIVHIGLGNFHRAHQAWYYHRLFQQGVDLDWAIIGAGVRPNDAAQREKLIAQDCLTTLIELDPAGTSAEVVGSMIDYVPIEQDNASLIRQMADPRIRIVSLTVTEGGYFIDPVSGRFDSVHEDIRHDAASPEVPRTAFGAMVAALKLRRDLGIGPFTGLSCDNLQGNGNVLRQTVVSLARMSDSDLADWIDAECSFPNSMVDCIVPATGSKEIALAASLGIGDNVPVTHENFRQWVVEDRFCAGRPDLSRAGVILSDDVHGYETMKIRMLNAGHQLIANPGELLSIDTIADCMAHELIRGFFRKVELEEIAPHVRPPPGIGPQEYADLIDRRFSNPAIVDTTRRVAFDGSSRHTGFLLPTLKDGLAAGTPIGGLALAEAFWARMCAGQREDGSRIEPNDPHWQDLNAIATEARHRPRAWLEQRHIYGELADAAPVAEAFEHWLGVIWSEGTEGALRRYLGLGV